MPHIAPRLSTKVVEQIWIEAAEKPDLQVGGGDDWLPLKYVKTDHKGKSSELGTFGTCETCGKGLVFDGFRGPNEEKQWKHVRGLQATFRSVTADDHYVNPSTFHGQICEGTGQYPNTVGAMSPVGGCPGCYLAHPPLREDTFIIKAHEPVTHPDFRTAAAKEQITPEEYRARVDAEKERRRSVRY